MDDELFEFPEDKTSEELALEAEADRRKQEIEDIKYIMRSPAGERFFIRFLREGCVFRTTFAQDPLQSAFLEGHRNLALKIFTDIVTAAPDKVPLLLVEGKDK